MTLALSWGPYGGFYLARGYGFRLCLGRAALTWLPVELDRLCAGYAAHKRAELEKAVGYDPLADPLAPFKRVLDSLEG